MDELRDAVRKDVHVKEEAMKALALIADENFVTKLALLDQRTIENTVYKKMIHVAGEELIDLRDDNEKKDCIVTEYAAVIEDDVLNVKILNTGNESFNRSYDPSRITTKNFVVTSLLNRLNRHTREQ